MKNALIIIVTVACAALFVSPSMAADHPGADYAWEYSSYAMPETGVTRGQKIFRWASESFVNDDGDTIYRCKYVWTGTGKQDPVKTMIQTKYPSEKSVDDLVKDVEK